MKATDRDHAIWAVLFAVALVLIWLSLLWGTQDPPSSWQP